MNVITVGCVVGAVVLLALVFRSLTRRLMGVAVKSGLGLVALWLFQGIGGALGVHLGVNLLNGVVLGVLGAPGFALLLLTQWVVR